MEFSGTTGYRRFRGTTAATDRRGLVISVPKAQPAVVATLLFSIKAFANPHEADVDIPLSVQTSSPFFLERSYPGKTNRMRDF